MQIGIGLPNPVNGYAAYPGTRIVEWARRAEQRGFDGLATIDRLAYPNYDSLTVLAAAAGATERIGLLTNILIAPLYPTASLAKITATIDQVSGGRLTLGLAPGGRENDYTVAGLDFAARGRTFDTQLEQLHAHWSAADVTPAPVNGGRVPILFGGSGPAAQRRISTWGAGFTIGGAAPEQAATAFEQACATWAESGREGEPRLAALAYYSLGDDADADSRAYLRHYYAIIGDYAEMIANGALRTPEAIKGAVRGFADAGATELYLVPTTSDLDQIDRLADVVR